MSDIADHPAWVGFERLLLHHQNGGLWHFEQALRSFVVANDWGYLFPLGDKREFHRRAVCILSLHSRRSYQAHRLEQLTASGVGFWVYCTGIDCKDHGRHSEFDGLSLPRSHKFWGWYFPANGWTCDCHTAGASSARGVLRLGGDPDKPLPSTWDTLLPTTGLPAGIEAGFVGQVHPDLATCFNAVLAGLA